MKTHNFQENNLLIYKAHLCKDAVGPFHKSKGTIKERITKKLLFSSVNATH